MSKAYQFPHDEPNPFAEQGAAQPAMGANPYAAGVEAAQSAVVGPGAYEQTLAPRTGLLLVLGVMSLICSFASLVAGFFCLPVGLFALMLSAPSVAMAQHDLKAMKFGAMENSQRGSAKVALVLGLVASAINVVSLFIPVAIALWYWSAQA